MKDDLKRGEDTKSNSDTEKADSDEISPDDDDFGSLYVTDEVFFMLIQRFIDRT